MKDKEPPKSKIPLFRHTVEVHTKEVELDTFNYKDGDLLFQTQVAKNVNL